MRKTLNFKGRVGFTQLQLIVTIVVLLALAGAAVALTMYMDRRDKRNQTVGEERERVKWQKRELVQQATYADKLKELEDRYRALEQQTAVDLAAVSAKHQGDLRDAKARRDRDVAAVHAGYRLRDPGRNAASCPAGGSGTASAPAAAPGRDGATGSELSVEATGFLLELAGEADDAVMQLQRAQDLVRVYQARCS